jgi:hypothetical protein
MAIIIYSMVHHQEATLIQRGSSQGEVQMPIAFHNAKIVATRARHGSSVEVIMEVTATKENIKPRRCAYMTLPRLPPRSGFREVKSCAKTVYRGSIRFLGQFGGVVGLRYKSVQDCLEQQAWGACEKHGRRSFAVRSLHRVIFQFLNDGICSSSS